MDNDGNKQIASADDDRADILNNYFASVFNEEESNSTTNITISLPNVDMENISIIEDDIKKRLDLLNVNKSPGPDALHPRILKEISTEISVPLKIIFDNSIRSGSLPDEWKLANVTPIFKKGKRCEANNYRPVSLTCIICKILESIIRDNLLNHFLRNHLFNDKQYGFIKGRSTTMQLLKVLDIWTKQLESGGQIDVVYTDLEKAFDKVPHKLLIDKLRKYNVSLEIINWIEDFLKDRKQRVRVGQKFSKWAKVKSGIPQGSILGPMLFIIYINDLFDDCNSGSDVFLYADDAKLFKHIYDNSDCDILQKDIDNLHEWIKKWLLKLNIDKCKVMTFGRNAHVSHIVLNENI